MISHAHPATPPPRTGSGPKYATRRPPGSRTASSWRSDDPAVELERALGHGFPGETLVGGRPRTRTHAVDEGIVGSQSLQHGSEGADVTGREDETGPFVVDDFRHA